MAWALWEGGNPGILGNYVRSCQRGMGPLERGIPGILGNYVRSWRRGRCSVVWALWKGGIPGILGNYVRSWRRGMGPLGRRNSWHFGELCMDVIIQTTLTHNRYFSGDGSLVMLGLGRALWALWKGGIPGILGNYVRFCQRP